MRKSLVFLLLVCLTLLVTAGSAMAQRGPGQGKGEGQKAQAPRNLQRSLSVSIASWESVLNSVDQLLVAAGLENQQLALQAFREANGTLPGLDSTKPLLVLLLDADAQGVVVKGYSGITNFDDFSRNRFASNLRLPYPRWDEQGIAPVILPFASGQTVFLQQRESGLFFATDRAALATLSDNLATSSASSLGSFLMSARLDVPPIMKWSERQLKDMYAMQKHVMAKAMEEAEAAKLAAEQPVEEYDEYDDEGEYDEYEDEYDEPSKPAAPVIDPEKRKEYLADFGTSPFAKVVEGMKQLKMFAVRLGVDGSTGAVVSDVVVTALEGTELAALAAASAEAKSNLSGFYFSDAAISYQVAAPIAESTVERYKQGVDQSVQQLLDQLAIAGWSEEQLVPIQGFLDSLAGVLKATIDGRQIDFGVSLLAPDPSMVAIIAAARVGDSVALERLFRQLVQANPIAQSLLTLNAETFEGIRMHTIAIPTGILPLGDSVPALSRGMTGVIGFSPEAVYLAVGTGAMEALKDAVLQSKASENLPVPTAQFSISVDTLGNVLEGFGPLVQNEAMAPYIETLQGLSSKSRISFRSAGIKPASQRIQLKIDAELLATAGALLMGQVPGAVEQYYDEQYFEQEVYDNDDEDDPFYEEMDEDYDMEDQGDEY